MKDKTKFKVRDGLYHADYYIQTDREYCTYTGLSENENFIEPEYLTVAPRWAIDL